jgi:hypothetical protein
MNRQTQFVNLIPAFENASGIFPFQGGIDTDYRFNAWNVMIQWEPEFFGNPTDEALSGKKRSNFRGYRMKATLSLDNTTQASGLRSLFNKLSSGFDRLVWQSTHNATDANAGSTVVKTPAPNADHWLLGTTISGLGGTTTRTILSYANSTKTATWTTPSAPTVANDPVYFFIKPNIETIVLFDPSGGSTTYTDSNIIACNAVSNNFGVARESTINKQRVSLELESIQLFRDIPALYEIP